MANVEPFPLLSALRAADTVESRVLALNAIKNNIVGHELRKTAYIRCGLIVTLSEILQQTQKSAVANDGSETQEDRVWTHATNIVGSLAYGGPSFVQPILQSTLISSLTEKLSTTTNSRLLLAILKCLCVVADNLPLHSFESWTPDRRLANLLYNPTNAACLNLFITQASSTNISQQLCDAALALICKTCVEDKYKALLVRADILSTLAERLASFVVAEGFVLPGPDTYGADHNGETPLPQPAPFNAHLCPVLETLGLLTESSKSYATQLVNHSAIVAVLPASSDDFSPTDIKKSPWGATYFSGAAVPRTRMKTPLDLLLPHLPDSDVVDPSDSFPPLGVSAPQPKRRSSALRSVTEFPSPSSDSDNTQDRDDSMLGPWLFYLTRTYRGKRRVLASRILVTIAKFGLLSSTRATSYKAMVTPLLVQTLDQKPTIDGDKFLLLTGMTCTELVPSILARLIMDDKHLQRTAFESKAINRLAVCLKGTFEPKAERAVLWRPWKQTSTMKDEAPACNLGCGGPSLHERHTMTYREGLLQSLAAIAPFDDRYRKEICDQGVLAQIMLALEPFHSEAVSIDGENPSLKASGNSASTLLAACDAVRALTRSVTALRTKLVDADIGKAIVKLLHSSDPEVTIAATRVVVNLATEFSPMKSSVSEPALVKKLCEQAHSANARLRLESIWALKHLVLESNNSLKRDVINGLGANWIRHLIATDPYDIPQGEVIGLVERDYPPRHVRYTDASDVIMSDDSGDEESVMIDAIRDDSDYTKHTVEDDLAIQEQLLDLLRNLFCGDSAAEIAEYVLGEIGYQEFIRILMDRLKARTMVGATRKANQTSSAPPGIVTAALNIIVHLCCQPRFRNMITGNLSLMRQVLLFHQNPDKKIRAAICWIAINLTYGENPAEREACRSRAMEMNRAGFLSHMRRMENDAELDVRERAKTAVLLLDKLIPKEQQR